MTAYEVILGYYKIAERDFLGILQARQGKGQALA